jgi:thioesterase domain-containing protein/acyl carrier protein
VDRAALPAPDETRLDWAHEFVAPRDALELELVQLWEEILNVRPVGIRDNFFALGGHSFLALRVISQVEKRFGKELPLAALIQGGTVEHLAGMIRQEAVQALPWQALVPIKRAGTKTPFFAMHPIGGQVFCYVDLARHLGPEQPFYGLQAPRPEDAGDEQVSIEEMADYYLRAVQGVQPEGPYLLGGYSFGGFVAFEMAQKLQQQGQEVALLALLDCRSPLQFNQLPAYEEDDAFMLTLRAQVVAQEQGRALDITVEEFRGLDYDAQLAHFIARMHEAKLLPPEHDLNFMRHFMRGFKARQRAMRNYFPAVYPGRVTLYRASKQNNWMLANFAKAGVDIHDRAYGWGTLSAQPVEVFDVPGNHDQVCYEPHVKVLAKRMRADIARAMLERPGAMLAGPAAQLSPTALGQRMRDGMKKFLGKE